MAHETVSARGDPAGASAPYKGRNRRPGGARVKNFSHCWTWHFDHPPEEVWPLLADSARFNEAVDVPKHEICEDPQPDGTVDFYGGFRKGPVSIVWKDEPVNWIANERFRHCCSFTSGPFERMCSSLDLAREGRNGCVATYRLEVSARNALGCAVLSLGFIRRWGRRLDRAAEGVRAFLDRQRDLPFETTPREIAAETRRRIDAMVKQIERSPNGHGFARPLADYVLAAQDTDLIRIRPLRLAKLWQADERSVIECCLQAVRAGLLNLRWDLLCPRCQGAKISADRLDALPQDGHCPSCNIDYGRDFAANVELTFRPAQTIRDITDGEFCLFGPMSTPHVKLQQTVAAGETAEFPLTLAPGAYRLRTLHPGGEEFIDWHGGPFPAIIADLTEVRTGAEGPDGRLRLRNSADKAVTFVVESREWARDALTAHRATTYQTFRDLFSAEVLEPGDEVPIQTVTLMFTDLKGSTAMYSRIGDARAYRYVQEHFAFLGSAVRAHNGAIVKTIGDAVMAAYADPVDALRAAVDIQDHTAELRERTGEDGLVIKLGFHTGPCIAVTLNDRLDYFGTTVNLAARLQEESLGDDIVFSTSVADDPAVAAILAGVPVSEERTDVKGFDVPIRFHRIAAGAFPTAAKAAAA